MIADRIGRTSHIDLIGVSPTLLSRAVPRRTGLDGTSTTSPSIGDGEDADSNVGVAPLHQREIVRGTFDSHVLAVSELEERLVLPLPGCAPFGVAGETHARGLKGSHDGFGALGGDVDGSGLFEHLEVAGDLIQGKLLGPLAFVDDNDLEFVGVACVE